MKNKEKYILGSGIFIVIALLSVFSVKGNLLSGSFQLSPVVQSYTKNGVVLKVTTPTPSVDPFPQTQPNSLQTIQTGCGVGGCKVAFVVLSLPGTDFPSGDLDRLNAMKKDFQNRFLIATNGLMGIAIDPQNFSIELNDSFLTSGKTLQTMTGMEDIDIRKVTMAFYKKYPDGYDFLNFVLNFNDAAKFGHFQTPYHVIVRNKVYGIGYQIIDQGLDFGSKSRLLGVTYLGYISDKGSSHDYDSSVWLHETAHQWCCYTNDNTNSLQIDDGSHFVPGLATPYGSQIMTWTDAYNVFDKADGTFQREYNTYPIQYHPFILYFMGILPKNEYSDGYDLFDVSDGVHAKWLKSVSVNDIIAAEGPRYLVNTSQGSSGANPAGPGGNGKIPLTHLSNDVIQ